MGEGGVTYPYKKTSMATNLPWTDFQRGFGDDLSATPKSTDHFIGLENLHYLTSQAPYTLTIFLTDKDGNQKANYTEFVVGDEASSYSLSFDDFRTDFDNPCTALGRGFMKDGKPPRFVTKDQDPEQCVKLRAAPGWYDDICTGYSPFVDILSWPTYKGGFKLFRSIHFALIRTGDFKEN
ncbi:hypothetical protein ACOMHN_007324 [Nucella lapillus]